MISGLKSKVLGVLAGCSLCSTLLAAQDERPSAAPEPSGEAPRGFRVLPSPPRAWKGPTPAAFAARAERGALLLTRPASGKKGEEVARLDYLPHGAWRVERVARLPVETSRPPRSLGWVPLAGEAPAWTLAVAGPARHPLLLLPTATPSFARFAGSRAGSPLPLATDLDRSGRPELWFLATRASDPGSGFLALPRVQSAVGTAEQDFEIIEGDWLARTADSTEILAWDLDRDLFEDLLVCRRGPGLEILRNRGGLDFEAANSGIYNRGEVGAAPRAASLRLGPERAAVQWGLAWAGDGSTLVLLSRKPPEAAFAAEQTRPAIFAAVHALDARIADLDANGQEELWLLARHRPRPSGPWGGAELFRFDLPTRAGEAPRPAGRSEQPGAFALRLGDLDGDGSIDLVLPRKNAPPYVYANQQAQRSATLRVTLEDGDERYHAIGSYVELHDGAELLMRRRWPPLQSSDQCQLWLSWDAQGLRSKPELRVTWPDGNSVEVESEPGAYHRLRR